MLFYLNSSTWSLIKFLVIKYSKAYKIYKKNCILIIQKINVHLLVSIIFTISVIIFTDIRICNINDMAWNIIGYTAFLVIKVVYKQSLYKLNRSLLQQLQNQRFKEENGLLWRATLTIYLRNLHRILWYCFYVEF